MYDPAKEFLESAKEAHAKAARLSRKVIRLEAQVGRITPAYSGMPSCGGKDNSAAWIALAQLREDYLKEKVEAEKQEKAVSDFIELCRVPEHREVLHLRYCERLRWPEVLKRMIDDGYCYSDRQIFRIHGRALNEAREIWKEKSYEESRDT